MEYFNHMKPKKALGLVTELVGYAASLCPDVELTAEDATRSERSFLISVICAAIGAGAGTVTLCDAAGESLPQELSAFIGEMYTAVPSLSSVELGGAVPGQPGTLRRLRPQRGQRGGHHPQGHLLRSSGYLSIGQLIQITRARGDALGVTTDSTPESGSASAASLRR
jgi:2-isopropylmalate synthase